MQPFESDRSVAMDPIAFVCGHFTIRSSGQGCGDADLRGQGLMNGATLGDVQ